jgi:arsenite-transporting ATPase
VVVDTAPTGHTLRLLALPRLAGEWLDALDAVEARHRTVVVALSGAPAPDEASRALERLRADLDTLRSRFVDPAHTRFLLVSTSEPVVREETRRLRSALAEQRVSVAGLVLNRAGPGDEDELEPGVGGIRVPALREDPRGTAGLRAFAARVGTDAAPPDPERAGSGARIRVGEPWVAPPGRRLYLVGGKGGVGKSTLASALAARLAGEGGAPVLLFSTDPAGSLGEVWETAVGSEARQAPGVPGLHRGRLPHRKRAAGDRAHAGARPAGGGRADGAGRRG